MNRIKHNHPLSISLSMEEDTDSKDIDHIKVKVTQHSLGDDDKNDCVATIQLCRIMQDYDGDKINFIEIADSQNQGIYETVAQIFKREKDSAIGKLVKNDSVAFMESFIYIDKMIIPKKFDLSSIAPAISMTLKKLNKGIDSSLWVCAVHNNNTFVNSNETQLMSEVTNKVLKDLGFKEISSKKSLEVDSNTISIVGGLTLNKNLELDSKYDMKNEINKTIDDAIENIPDVKKFREKLNLGVNKPYKNKSL